MTPNTDAAHLLADTPAERSCCGAASPHQQHSAGLRRRPVTGGGGARLRAAGAGLRALCRSPRRAVHALAAAPLPSGARTVSHTLSMRMGH